jgi:hypothetical protein
MSGDAFRALRRAPALRPFAAHDLPVCRAVAGQRSPLALEKMTMRPSFRRLCLSFLSLVTLSAAVTIAAPALAQESAPAAVAPPSGPRLGGHLGMALPLATFGQETTLIGRDFTTIGLTPGVTFHLDDKWAIDFEFIAFNETKNTPARTTFIVDPGVLRKFDGFVTGLRVATQVGAPTNIGLVPIVVVPFRISEKLSYFVEADVPLFLRDDGKEMRPSATLLFQTGVGF